MVSGASGEGVERQVPRRCESVLEEEFEDELVLCEPVREQVVVLNPMGAAVWELCDGARSVGEIVGEIVAHTGAPSEKVREDVAAFLADLVARGFLALGAGTGSNQVGPAGER